MITLSYIKSRRDTIYGTHLCYPGIDFNFFQRLKELLATVWRFHLNTDSEFLSFQIRTRWGALDRRIALPRSHFQ